MSHFLHYEKNETRTSHSWKVIKKINKNFNSTKTLYLQGKPRIFWKIKKKYEKIKTKIEEKYKKENRREKTWSIRILIKMEMQLW